MCKSTIFDAFDEITIQNYFTHLMAAIHEVSNVKCLYMYEFIENIDHLKNFRKTYPGWNIKT